MHQDSVTMCYIEEVVLEGHVGYITNVKSGVRMPSGVAGSAGQVNLRGFRVDSMDLSGVHRSRQSYGDCAWATAKIEDAKARLQVEGVSFRAAPV